MSYAIREDGLGWRSVSGPDDVVAGEYFSLDMPADRQKTISEMALDVRAERDRRLYDCDWTQLVDSPLEMNVQAEWKLYRQALRDITKQKTFPQTVTWPVKPSQSN